MTTPGKRLKLFILLYHFVSFTNAESKDECGIRNLVDNISQLTCVSVRTETADQALASCPSHVKAVYFKNVVVSPKTFQLLAKLLATNKIETLTLDNCITFADIQVFASHLHPHRHETNLKHLSLSNNFLNAIPDNFFEVFGKHLVSIDLSFNKLTRFNHNMQHAPSLHTIILSSNAINSFPTIFRYQNVLYNVYLDDNSIVHIPRTDLKLIRDRDLYLDLTRNLLHCRCPYFRAKIKLTCKINKDLITVTYLNFKDLLHCKHDTDIDETTADIQSTTIITTDNSSFSVQNSQHELTIERSQYDSQITAQREFAFHSIMPVRETIKKISDQKTFDILKPEYGVAMKTIGTLVPTISNYYLHLLIKIPSLELPEMFNYTTFTRICSIPNSIQPAKSICEDFMPLLENLYNMLLVYRRELSDLFIEINTFLNPIGIPYRPKRNKRDDKTGKSESLFDDDYSFERTSINLMSILPPLSIIKLNALTHKRFTILEKAVDKIFQQEKLDFGTLYDLQNDLATVTQVTDQKFANVSNSIQKLNLRIIETTATVVDAVRKIMQVQDYVETNSHSIRLLSMLTTRYLIIAEEQIAKHKLLIKQCEDLLLALNAAVDNRLLPTLIKPTILRQILRKLAYKLQSSTLNVNLADHNIEHFYTALNNHIQILPMAILLQLEIPLIDNDSPTFNLLKADSVHVPVNSHVMQIDPDIANPDITKLEIHNQYIAVSKQSYILLSNADLQSCPKVASTYYCSNMLLEKLHSVPSCLSSLYFGHDTSTIIKNCDIKYYFNFTPPPEILETETEVLLANLPEPWLVSCRNELIPKFKEAARYTVLKTSSLCSCSLTTSVAFLPRKLAHCSAEDMQDLTFSFTTNMIAYNLFQEQLQLPPMITPSFNLDHKNLSFPKLPVVSESNDAILQSEESPVSLKKLSNLIKSKAQIYKDTHAKIASDLHVSSWFKSANSLPKAIFVLCSVAGLVGLVIALLLCLKNNKLKAIIQTLTFAASPKSVAANPVHNEITISLPYEAYLYFAITNILVLLAFVAAVTAIRAIMRRYRAQNCVNILRLQRLVQKQQHPTVNYYLQFSKAAKFVLVHIMNDNADIGSLQCKGIISEDDIKIQLYKTFAILTVNWQQICLTLTADATPIILPHLIQVPFTQFMKFKQIVKEPGFMVSLVAADRTNIVNFSESENTEPTMSDTEVINYENATATSLKKRYDLAETRSINYLRSLPTPKPAPL